MFALSGHIFFAICLALGLLQIQPERSTPLKRPVVQVRLKAAKAVAPAHTRPGGSNPPPVGTTLPAQPAQMPAPPAFEPTVTPGSQPMANPAETLSGIVPMPAKADASLKQAAPAGTTGDNTAQNGNPAQSPPATGSTIGSESTAGTTASKNAVAAQEAAAAIDIPYYYSLKQLTEKPRVVEDATTNMNLVLPGVETQNVILRLLINEQGSIDQVEIEHSNLMSDIEAIVTAAFAKLRFSPGKIDGVAVKCQLQIEVSLENADQPPLQRLPLR